MPNHTLHKNFYLEKNRSVAQQSMMSQTYTINKYVYDHYRESFYFPHSSRPVRGPTSILHNGHHVSSPGGKAAGAYR